MRDWFKTRAARVIVALMLIMTLALPAYALTTVLNTSSNKTCPDAFFQMRMSVSVVPGASDVLLKAYGYKTGTNDPIYRTRLGSDTNNDGVIYFWFDMWKTRTGPGGWSRQAVDNVATLDHFNATACYDIN